MAGNVYIIVWGLRPSLHVLFPSLLSQRQVVLQHDTVPASTLLLPESATTGKC